MVPELPDSYTRDSVQPLLERTRRMARIKVQTGAWMKQSAPVALNVVPFFQKSNCALDGKLDSKPIVYQTLLEALA